MVKGKRNLTEGNILRQLIRLTWPMLLGMIGMVIFNLIDTYFVGKLGVHQLAAMSFCFPVIMFLNSLSQGVGIGTSSLISRKIMNTDRSEVGKMASRAILLGVMNVTIFVTIGLLTIRPLFTALGAENEVLNYIYDYMSIWYFGVPFVVIPMIGNNIVRATGDTFTPGMIMVINAGINIILDPFFIFGIGPFPEMGIAGAALTTVISRGTGLMAILFVLVKREKLLTLHLGPVRNILRTWKKVLYVAIPASLTMLIIPISVGLLTKILSGFGNEAVAAFGVASRVEMFAMMTVIALGSVLIIFVGQNISKQKFARIFEALRLSARFSLAWGALIFLVLVFFGQGIASLFSEDTQVIEITRHYFYIIGASYGFQGLVLLSTQSFNGLNKPIPSAVFSMIRMLVLYVPLAWLASKLFGINGVFAAGFIANVSIGILAFLFLRKTIKKMELSA